MKPLLLASLICYFSCALGQEPDSANRYRVAAETVDADLRAALDELTALREAIAEEKPAISNEANRIAAELREAKRQSEISLSRKDAVEAEFEKTEADLKTWRDEKIYLEGLFNDFEKNFGSAEKSDVFTLVEEALGLIAESGNIAISTEKVINGEGVLVEGSLADAGPVAWFLSDDRKTAGIVTEGAESRLRVIPGTVSAGEIESLIAGNSATLSFDPTLGNAVAMTETGESLLDHVKQGGFWIIPILLLAFIALIAAIAKWLQLHKIRSFEAATVQRVIDAINEGDFEKARTSAASIQHPSGVILEHGIRVLERSPSAKRDDLEEALFEKFLEAQPPLQRGLPLIAIASATAPLLGLLGTVTGMIETFRLINIFGTGDAKTLASGISEALVTTEFGLIVAIPALILHALLSRKITGIKSSMEMTSLAVLNGIDLKGGRA